MVVGYPFCKSLPFASSAKHVAPQDVSATSVFEKIHNKKRNRLTLKHLKYCKLQRS